MKGPLKSLKIVEFSGLGPGPLAGQLLADLGADVITVDKIQNVVSNYYNIPLSDMLSQRRSRPLARPRQVAMYLAKKMTSRSLPEIGRRFANRDHTTVIHAVKTITRLSEQDDEMKKNISQIKSLLLEQ